MGNNMVIGMEKVRETIRSAGGHVFTVCFRKRTNNELRIMNARLGVQKELTGKGLAFDPKQKQLMTVFDMQKNAYRMIDLNSVIWIKVDGIQYTVDA